MTNADVIKMVSAGLNETIIVAAIRQAKHTSFDISADGLVALKTAGVSDGIVAVMLDPSVVPAVPSTAVASSRSPSSEVLPGSAPPADDPSSPHRSRATNQAKPPASSVFHAW
jgi:hypothetical protein